MTQVQLAQLLHVSDRAISKWENGRGLPDPSNMMMLAQALGITVNELLAAGVINDDMEFRKKAEENILSVMVSTPAMETMKLISLLVMITCIIPVVYISAYGFSTSGWIIGFSGCDSFSFSVLPDPQIHAKTETGAEHIHPTD